MEHFNTLQPATESYSNKRSGEKARRASTNEKTEELRMLVQEQGERKLSIEETLKKALEVAQDLLKSSDISVKGASLGVKQIESLTASFIDSMGIPQNVKDESVRRLQGFFKMQFDNYFTSSQSAVQAHPDSAGPSRKSPIAVSTTDTPVDQKKLRADREQLRRDRQLEANNELTKFIFDNNLAPVSDRLEKLRILEIVIAFIKEKRSNGCQPKTVQEMALYTKGISEGHSFGKYLANMFFKNHQHLVYHCGALEVHLNLHLNPQPFLGFPQFPLVQVTPQPVLPIIADVFKNPMSISGIPRHQMVFPTPPPSDAGSPPTSSPSTSSAGCHNTSGDENKTPKKQEKKFFRPWE